MIQLYTVYKKLTLNLMIQADRKDEKRHTMQTLIKEKASVAILIPDQGEFRAKTCIYYRQRNII